MPKIDESLFAFLGDALGPPPPPEKPATNLEDSGWSPSLNPTQQDAFDCTAKYVLCYGEKGSGKTIGALHAMVRHCYENHNAFGLILVKQKAMATKGGAWDKLIGHILPKWKEGIGLNHSEVKMDSQHHEYVWIENCFGGWSQIGLISAPHANQLRERIRGYEPSFAFVDELTSCESLEYLQAVAAQVGRREGVLGLQQYYAACNPEGPSHWVYKRWWEEAFIEEEERWDEDYAKFHIPIQENRHNLPDGYIENLEKLYRNDPIEADRMLRGIWVERPSGEAIFADSFNVAIHVAPLNKEGQPDSNRILVPDPNYAFIIGMDPGSVYNSFSFQQWLPPGPGLPWTDEMGWMVFDEVCIFKRKLNYDVIVPILMRKIRWWRELIQARPPQAWIADNSAFNQFRPGNKDDASYDSLLIERIYEALRIKFGLEAMKIKEAPKFGGSRQIRVRQTLEDLNANRILISSHCVHHRNMFLRLESEKQKANGEFDASLVLSPKRSDWIHVFDSFSYPRLTSTLAPSKLTPSPVSSTSDGGPPVRSVSGWR